MREGEVSCSRRNGYRALDLLLQTFLEIERFSLKQIFLKVLTLAVHILEKQTKATKAPHTQPHKGVHSKRGFPHG